MVKRFFITIFLGVYRLVRATGFLNTRLGRRLFESVYHQYKKRFEAGPTQVLRQWVRPKTVVVDVGANVGFFTVQFASWVSDGGKVIAVEPESLNYSRLQEAVSRAGFTGVVETIQAALADHAGEGSLEINPHHPGDHKLSTQGVKVTLSTIDDLLAARGWPEVSLIKIDVQGAEAKVVAGARQTIEKFRPVLFLEVDDKLLQNYGTSAKDLLTYFATHGYSIHKRFGDGISPSLSVLQVLSMDDANAYDDLLFLPI